MKRITFTLAALALIAAPAFAVGFDPVIEHGSDIWQTRPDGTSFVSFGADPLPADFFCTGSEPFAGRIVMGGVPLDTVPVGALGATDTIVQRLDTAVFDESGVATSRIQLSAIQLRSVQPFRTACGAFTVDVTLADSEQPMGEMRIVRQGPTFGYYESKVSLNVLISFTPVEDNGPALEVLRHIDFPANRNFWASEPGENGIQYNGFVMVDTDANGEADTFVPGTSSNFAPGWFGHKDRGELLQRGARLEASGMLKEAPGPSLVTPQQDFRSTAAGLQSISEREPICSGTCHCENDGNHCQTSTTTAIQ